jgi:uncharacterized membrane protein required for colicin V production
LPRITHPTRRSVTLCRVTGLDWLIVAFAASLAAVGWAQGFIVGALSLAGFVGGAIAGARLGPLVLHGGAASPYAPLFALGGALIIGGALASGFEGVGIALRQRVRLPGLGAVDGLLGALLLGALGLAIAWIGGAVALQTPGADNLRHSVQRSAVLRKLNHALPPSGKLLNLLARFDPFPQINGPDAGVAAPPRGIVADPDVRAARRSVVRVLGSACGLGIAGSGWVAADGIIATNAHVVAGETDTTVQVGGEGDRLAATAIYFDARNDLALLRVDGLHAPVLKQRPAASSGTGAAILGFPGNGPYDEQPGRIGAERFVLAPDAYGSSPIRRKVRTLRGLVRHGNSGGPMVDATGRVVTTIFASTVDSTPPGGFGVPDDVVGAGLQSARGPVSTGPCAP